jgi:hypothetical protein
VDCSQGKQETDIRLKKQTAQDGLTCGIKLEPLEQEKLLVIKDAEQHR